MSLPSNLASPPPEVLNTVVTFPAPHVLLITLNRPAQLNAVPPAQHHALLALYEWYDAQPSLRCAILTGTGRAFCAGADLKAWDAKNRGVPGQAAPGSDGKWPSTGGFGGLSNRNGKKPVIAAVNGLCLGGGFEMITNADLVYALASAKFGLPEVKRGVVAIAGALPRIAQILGRQRASEMAMLGDMYTAAQMRDWGIVNGVVEGSADDLIRAVLQVAEKLANNSPDSIIVTREGLMSGLGGEAPQQATNRVEAGIYQQLEGGDNIKEGVLAFVEKRQPVWKDSKL
ncbi:carnitinyl-CoA dehydratase [Verticillium alfalfae VaMs.102]|uniref:Carnitinyl-CoA dehydratase n=1 Tax=Verticillium alfalfae (strain VaMs.102 / ATCC MYA-4576 / FGSC 10136) TaxID=526221 RepID=C9S5H2_VERA1|nr:carnitinyl-CoA dehydratase [Verticillium alfalfae VaMs.102]EEY15049.1 carnitinyl-CoA dehydratase [Verticillium alfalfae VaMs.102]